MTRGYLLTALLAACYNPPAPDCTFVCGPGGACEDGYTCAADHRCHRDDALDVMCPVSDAGVGVAPQLTSIDPLNEAQGVALDVMPSFTADQQLVGVTNQTFYLLEDIAPVAGRLDFHEPSMHAAFIPDRQLDAFAHYTVVIDTGITNVTGQPLERFEWSFITGPDNAPPRVTRTVPESAATAQPTSTNIMVTFDEDVTGVDTTSFTVDAGGPIAGSVSQQGAISYTFAPASLLPAGATVTVTLGTGIRDLNQNDFAGYSFSFTTQ